MAKQTESGISWCDYTFNPWIGCTKVSPACDNCYAAQFGQRFGIDWGAGKPRKRTSPSNWFQVVRWNRRAEIQFNAWQGFKKEYPVSDEELIERGFVKPTPPRVFCASLADVFDNEVPLSWRADLFELIANTPFLDWMLLTKRIVNVAKFIKDDHSIGAALINDNVSLGITVCNQEEADRDIPKLLSVPAHKRFLSIEPMLGKINFRWNTDLILKATGEKYREYLDRTGSINEYEALKKLDLIIVGGESGQNARPMHPDWARSISDQCNEAGVDFHFKQWGEFNSNGERVGKKAAGRLLDGIEHY